MAIKVGSKVDAFWSSQLDAELGVKVLAMPDFEKGTGVWKFERESGKEVVGLPSMVAKVSESEPPFMPRQKKPEDKK